jgi:hypothetical protein
MSSWCVCCFLKFHDWVVATCWSVTVFRVYAVPEIATVSIRLLGISCILHHTLESYLHLAQSVPFVPVSQGQPVKTRTLQVYSSHHWKYATPAQPSKAVPRAIPSAVSVMLPCPVIPPLSFPSPSRWSAVDALSCVHLSLEVCGPAPAPAAWCGVVEGGAGARGGSCGAGWLRPADALNRRF